MLCSGFDVSRTPDERADVGDPGLRLLGSKASSSVGWRTGVRKDAQPSRDVKTMILLEISAAISPKLLGGPTGFPLPSVSADHSR